jgi:hypothetical protein
MATSTKNILVGAASLYVSNGNSSNNAGRPSTTANDLSNLFTNYGTAKSARTGLSQQTSGYREVGYTSTGLEISYEPTYGEVMVDQLLDAARIFKQSLKVVLKTELTEGTLENLQLSWGQMDSYAAVNQYGSLVNTPTIANNDSSVTGYYPDSPSATLNMAAGALGDAPVERVLIAVGQAPAQIGTSVDIDTPTGVNGGVNSTYTGSTTGVRRGKERVYVARRVVSIDTTAHGLKRDTATVFPVTFRCLPDSDPNYAGSEYGVVIDRVYGIY